MKTGSRRARRLRKQRRRRRWVIGLLLGVVVLVVSIDLVHSDGEHSQAGFSAAYDNQLREQTRGHRQPEGEGTRVADEGSARPSPRALPPSSGPPLPSVVAVPERGSGTFTIAAGTGPVLGNAGGQFLRYHVMVEDGTGQQPGEFATIVESTLGDPRGWIAGGEVGFQRVDSASPDFVIYLASPKTVDELCAPLDTQGYTSCRVDNRVVVNLARWLLAVPEYGNSLTDYRHYVINHEVGHRLGYGHEQCPGADQPAPVMQQQTLGLHGCGANPWPYVDGAFYRGPAV